MASDHYRGIPIHFVSARKHFLAVIGSREPSDNELKSAYQFAKIAAQKGKIIVSGLAKGIDAAAHRGAIDGNGKTIAIVNTPPWQSIYPKDNQNLAEDILTNGGIIYPFLTAAKKENGGNISHFKRRLVERNIFLAFLCPVIVVVKDGEPVSGGSKWALNYGKIFGKKLFRMDSAFHFYPGPSFEEAKIWWEPEINPEHLYNQLIKKE